MDVTPLIRAGQQVIQSYAGGKFRVSGIFYETPVIVTPEGTVAWDAPGDFNELKLDHFFAPPLTAAQSSPPQAGGIKGGSGWASNDVILLGTGKTMRFLPKDLKKALKDRGLNIDCMDTGAACRTYNVLMAEGRRVAAALLPYA